MDSLRNKIIYETDFSKNRNASCILCKLYKEICMSEDEIYASWLKNTNYIYGNFNTQRKIDFRKISKKYNIDINCMHDFYKLFYALDIYYNHLLMVLGNIKINMLKKNLCIDFDFVNYDIDINVKRHDLDIIKELDRYFNKKFSENDLQSYHEDIIQDAYNNIFEKNIIHSLGAFYTPNWLAKIMSERIISRNSSFIDPTCGSGVFLCNILIELQEKEKKYSIYGFDINPTAVFSAKTNYILAINNIGHGHHVIPVFETDIVNNEFNSPSEYPLLSNDYYEISIDKYKIKLKKDTYYSYDDFCDIYISLISGLQIELNENANDIYKQISKLELKNIQIRKLMDKISYVYVPKCDVVIGNPPWVNWEYLPKEYRNKSASLWQKYGLFDYKGINSVFIKEDISTLITYISADRFLKSNGSLLFILKESLLKSAKQASGFRKFHIITSNTELCPEYIVDLSGLKLFSSVINNAIILQISKGKKASYPVNAIKVSVKDKKRSFEYISKNNIHDYFHITHIKARPLIGDSNSGWMFYEDQQLDNSKIVGGNPYKARIGVFTGGANGLFWLDILESNESYIIARNLAKHSRNKYNEIIVDLEKEHVYPLVVGKDIGFWRFKYSKYILCPHTKTTKMLPIDLDSLNKGAPKTYNYVNYFRKELEQRKGFTSFDSKIHNSYFYALQRIGEYTFSKYKVSWKYIAKEFTPCVIEDIKDIHIGIKNVIPNEKISYIGLDNEDEAYYLCGILSATPYRKLINSFIIGTQISPSTIENINIPTYNNSELHREISRICHLGHHDNKLVDKCICEIDALLRNVGIS